MRPYFWVENTLPMNPDTLPSFLQADLLLCCPGRGSGTFQVALIEGGDQFPWAEHNGSVIIGPPMEEVVLDDGTPMTALDWHVNSHWVLEACNEKGEEITLNAAEHRYVMDEIARFPASDIANPCKEINFDA